MGKYTGTFDDLFEKSPIDSDIEDIYKDEESKYWIHRTILPSIYFNPSFKSNNCPILMTQQEIDQYLEEGRKIVGCTSMDVFYVDEESGLSVIEKLKQNGLTYDDLELELRNKLLEIFKSYFVNGLYMPDVYGTDLERTAHQYSVDKMKKIISKNNFGFNDYRGGINGAIILEIPVEEQQNIYEKLQNPIEYGTEYYGLTRISKVVSPRYIKGMVVKYGEETLYIKNPNYKENKIVQNNVQQEEQILYNIEELVDLAAQEFLSSELKNRDRVLTYINRIEQIENGFRKFARQSTGFVGTKRHMQIHNYLRSVPRIKPFVSDEKKGNGINMVMENRYYDEAAQYLQNSFIKDNENKKNINM